MIKSRILLEFNHINIPWIKTTQISYVGFDLSFLDITLDREFFKLPPMLLNTQTPLL